MQSLLLTNGTKVKTRLLVGLAATALFFGAAAAQDKPSQLETQPKPEIVDRDPFVNQIMDSAVVPPSWVTPIANRNPSQPETLSPNTDEPNDTGEQAAVMAAPDVSVTGIVGNNGERQAILRSGSGTRIVKVGQKLSDYRVSRISSKGVTFTVGAQDFEVPLDAEF